MYGNMSRKFRTEQIDRFKFRVELVQAILIEHESESVRKFQGHHSTEKKARPTKRCVVSYKNNRTKETVFWGPECEAVLCVEECFEAFHTNLNF